MWNSVLNLDKYEYMRTNPYLIRGLGALGILTTLLMAYGFWMYLHIDLIYLIIFGPIAAIFVINKLLRFFIQLFYPKYDIKKHEDFVRRYWLVNQEPTVDIFLPWAGEDLAVHEEVVKACANVNYKNLKVFMLDDVGREDHKALAQKYGFTYLSRPNKGEYKKSGNLQYGYQFSNGEYVFILDADFIPTKDSLHDLIPYIDSDKQIGILQTPQYFEQTKDVHNRSKIEFGGGNIVEDFYRVIMPCRDEFKAAMCVGTSAIYRRSTIDKLDGTPKVHASEDLATGLLITQHGFYVKYLPLIVSMGTSPETFQGYFKQHMRWCSGNIVFARYWPKAKLNIMARLIYLSNPTYYLSEAFSIIFSFQFLLLLYFHSDTLSLWNTLYFIPYMVLSRFVIPATKANKNKVGTRLAALNNYYTYFYTYIRMLTIGVPQWHPTGVKISKLHDDFLNAINIGTVISVTFILGFIFILISKPHIFGNYNTYVVLAWTFYAIFWHTVYLTSVHKYIHPFKLEEATNFFSKGLVYAKTHTMLILFTLVSSFAFFDISIAYAMPDSPTKVALNSLMDSDEPVSQNLDSDKKVAKIPPEVSVAKEVKVATQEAKLSEDIIMPVISGDSLAKLSKKVVIAYSEDNNITLTSAQINSVVNLIVKSLSTGKPIKPGETVIFSQSLIEDSIAVTLNTKKVAKN